MKISKIAWIFFLTPFAFILSQDFPPAERSKNLDRIEQMENAKLIQVLNLNEETSVRFFARRKDYREKQRSLLEERHKIIQEVEDMLKNDSKENSAYKEKLEQLLLIETNLVKEKKGFYKGLPKLLTDKQILQLVVFEENFRRQVRETLMNRNRKP